MTDSDVLARAAKALREAHTGERQGSGFTRARVMSSLHRDRRRRLLRWAVLSPLASVLLVGSAWAQSTGKWPVIWQAVAAVFVSAPAPELGEAPRVSPKPKASPRAEPNPPSATRLAPPADAGPIVAEGRPAPTLEERAPERPRETRKRARPHTKGRVPAQRETVAEPSVARDPPAEPARDRELSRFRDAHDLHFGGHAREAIRAYDEYLNAYPNGRFVPEARYNSALDQIKLGNTAAAREALEPFAEGRYGNYRRKEARQLLDALR